MMTTYPFKEHKDLLSKPYSDINQDKYTLKIRNVYCQNCHYETSINIYAAKCGQCKSFLIESPRLTNIPNEQLVK